MSEKSDAKITIRWNPRAQEETMQAIFAAVQDVFEKDIVGHAADGSPVLTGKNKRSITAEVSQVGQGVRAVLFTQSGYGGFLEVGTGRMPARPYLWPAFLRYRDELALACQRRIANLVSKMEG